MEPNVLNFFDEQGNMLPLEEIQASVKNIYEEMSNEPMQKLYDSESILDTLIRPEEHIKTEDTVETLLFLERGLYLYGVITEETANAFRDAITFWNKVDRIDGIPPEDRQPIKIFINSDGGDIPATLSIIDLIQMSETPVWTINIGKAYSGGFFVCIAGHKRFGYPSSTYLFHEGCRRDGGDAHKYLQGASFYKKELELLKKIVLKHTNISEEEYQEIKKDDLWLLADEALKKNVIDEITEVII